MIENQDNLAADSVSFPAGERRGMHHLEGKTVPDLTALHGAQGEPATGSICPLETQCGSQLPVSDLTALHGALGEPATGEVSRPNETQCGSSLTAAALAKGAERALILKAARPYLEERDETGRLKYSLEEVAQMIGTSAPTLCRLRRDFGHLGADELTAENLAAKTCENGRSSPWEFLAEQPEVQKVIHQLYYLTTGASSDYMAKDRATGSMALTMERFADHPTCPATLAAKLRAGKIPKPFLNLLRRITPEMEQRHRGPKHQALNGTLIQSREMIEIMADGSRQNISLGDWWVFDDMSDNQPNWFLGPDGEPLVGRQGLYAYDMCRRWLGVELIGTARDSYTAAIILRFIRRLMQSVGKPRRGIVLEQSVWKSRVISGFRRTASGEFIEVEEERSAMDEENKHLIQAGLRALGIIVHYTYTPRGKEIEGAFDYLQKVAPTFSPEQISIGRHAGEFEQGAKNLRRAHAQSYHPRDLGFAEMDARADVLEKTMQWINRRNDTTDYPSLGRLSQNDLAVFLPRKAEKEINGGKVSPEFEGQVYDFCNPELFASLGAGYRLYVKFDPAEPTLGAAIYNRETSSRNHHGWQIGQFIGWADCLEAVARFDWRAKADRDDTAGEMKRRFNKYIRTAFRAVGMPQFKAATARDGKGNVAVVGKDTAPSLPASSQASTRRTLGPDAAMVTERRQKLARDAERANKLSEF